jgi:hypothetical protein
MQTSIALVAVLAFVSLAAACGGRIETVDPIASEPPVPSTSASDPSAPSASAASAEPRDPPAPGCASFDQVLSELDRLGCATSTCHGSANLPLIDAAKPLETERGFYAFVLSNGMRYVDFRSLDPKSSAIACNLRGSCGVAMPLGGTAPASTIDMIERWLACGAPP